MALPGTIAVTGLDIDGGEYDAVMTIDMTSTGVRATSITVASAAGQPVTGTTLRGVRVSDIVRTVIGNNILRGERRPDGSLETYDPAALTAEQAASIRHGGPAGEGLAWAAFYGNAADVLGLQPTHLAQANLGLSRQTAWRWIRKARDHGLISSNTESQKGNDGKH